jgi:hypothetical protein
MPSESSDPQKSLFHIRDNIYLARTFVDGLDYEGFRDNQLVFYAVTRALEIISEASRRLSSRSNSASPPSAVWSRGRPPFLLLASGMEARKGGDALAAPFTTAWPEGDAALGLRLDPLHEAVEVVRPNKVKVGLLRL